MNVYINLPAGSLELSHKMNCRKANNCSSLHTRNRSEATRTRLTQPKHLILRRKLPRTPLKGKKKNSARRTKFSSEVHWRSMPRRGNQEATTQARAKLDQNQGRAQIATAHGRSAVRSAYRPYLAYPASRSGKRLTRSSRPRQGFPGSGLTPTAQPRPTRRKLSHFPRRRGRARGKGLAAGPRRRR